MSDEKNTPCSSSPQTPPGNGPFCGCHPARLDDQGRVLVPETWRSAIGETSVELLVFCVPDGTIRVLPPAAQEALYDRLRALPLEDHRATETLQRVLATATVATCDKSWRLTLAKQLRTQVQIETDVVLEGRGDLFEIRRAE